MGRKKIEIKPITEDRNRQVTLTKRKFGVFKKAHELAVLTKSDVALIIFDSQNRLYQYSSKPMKDILTRIIENPNPTEIHNKESMVALIKKKKKSGDKDDEHETDDEAESAHEAAHPPGPAAAAAAAAALPAAPAMRVETQAAPLLQRRRGPELTQLVMPPLGASAALAAGASAGPARLPSFGGPGSGFGMAGLDWGAAPLPSPMTLLNFSFPSSPVLHTTKAGDLIVSNSAQQNSQKLQQLQRQNSLGLGSFGLQRQVGLSSLMLNSLDPFVSDTLQFSSEFGQSGPQFSLSRMNSLSTDPFGPLPTPLGLSSALGAVSSSAGAAAAGQGQGAGAGAGGELTSHPAMHLLSSIGVGLAQSGAGPARSMADSPSLAAAAAAAADLAMGQGPLFSGAPLGESGLITAAAGSTARPIKRPPPIAQLQGEQGMGTDGNDDDDADLTKRTRRSRLDRP
eukprot:m.125494 g.125494  ORF g.125494 m.125494 type:complete len:454 (-) comp14673_c4_seq1:147-1508(-)